MGDNDSGEEPLPRSGEQRASGAVRGERVKVEQAETMPPGDVSHVTVT